MTTLKQKEFYNTIDLDLVTKEELEIIIEKIRSNDCCLTLQCKPSFSKGHHISMICSKKCDKCRLVFDDAKRFEMDSNRDLKYQNTLFDKKEYVHTNLKMLKHICERCEKYGNIQVLNKIDLTLEETAQKVKKGKILFAPELVYLGYVYLECPICHWFKFLRIGEI
jgi:hypothetical protein